MDTLKARFREKAQAQAADVKALLKDHNAAQVDTVDVGQIYGGMRDIIAMVWETSALDANEGIRFRGYSIEQLRDLLPKASGCTEPLPEGLFYLMLVGEIPTAEDAQSITAEWQSRSTVPAHVFTTLNALPADTHPMTQFSIAVLAMQTDSVFAKRYAEGMPKTDYWDATYEDAMNLIARLPVVASYIFRRSFRNAPPIAADTTLDWAGNFAHMMGANDTPEFKSLMRLYMTIHADHEGGNASAHTTHLVGSTLADPYYSFSAALGALAGPLHGLANQEVVRWIEKMLAELGTTTPTDAQVDKYTHDTLAAKKVVPGYGHAVLRKPDPRFMAQKHFAEMYCPNDPFVGVVWQIFRVVPPILQETGKIKNPWPNVDAHSGALLMHYGMTEANFYTVLFGVSRALGVLAAQCWSRALDFPLERPKSVTTNWVKEHLAKQTAAV